MNKNVFIVILLFVSIKSFSQSLSYKELIGTWSINNFKDTADEFRPMSFDFLNKNYVFVKVRDGRKMKMRYYIKDTLGINILDCWATKSGIEWRSTLLLKKINDNTFKVQEPYISTKLTVIESKKWNDDETIQNTGLMKRKISN